MNNLTEQDWESFKAGELTVQCNSKESAKEFLTILDKMGYLWGSGHRPLAYDNHWKGHSAQYILSNDKHVSEDVPFLRFSNFDERPVRVFISNYMGDVSPVYQSKNLSEIVLAVKEIISEDQIFKIEFYCNQVCFCIYESEVVISYTSDDNILCINCELVEGKIHLETIRELEKIMTILDNNKSLLRSFCEVHNG